MLFHLGHWQAMVGFDITFVIAIIFMTVVSIRVILNFQVPEIP